MFDYSTDQQVLDALNLRDTVNRNNTISKIESAYRDYPWAKNRNLNLNSTNVPRRL